MCAPALALRLVAVMAIVLTTAARYLAVLAMGVIGRRFPDFERRLGVFMRCAGFSLGTGGGFVETPSVSLCRTNARPTERFAGRNVAHCRNMSMSARLLPDEK